MTNTTTQIVSILAATLLVPAVLLSPNVTAIATAVLVLVPVVLGLIVLVEASSEMVLLEQLVEGATKTPFTIPVSSLLLIAISCAPTCLPQRFISPLLTTLLYATVVLLLATDVPVLTIPSSAFPKLCSAYNIPLVPALSTLWFLVAIAFLIDTPFLVAAIL